MVVVVVVALLGSCQLSLQLLDLVGVRWQLLVVAVDLSRSARSSNSSQAFATCMPYQKLLTSKERDCQDSTEAIVTGM